MFGENKKKLKILKLLRDSRYLQKLALKSSDYLFGYVNIQPESNTTQTKETAEHNYLLKCRRQSNKQLIKFMSA